MYSKIDHWDNTQCEMVQLGPVKWRSKSPGVLQHNLEQETGGGGKVREGSE